MSNRIKQATIIIDEIANALFPQPGTKIRGYSDILGELLSHLQDTKSDDPRYTRVVFAVDGQDRFVEVDERNINQTGVFTRINGTRFEYGSENRTIKNLYATSERDILVVANNEQIATRWERELRSIDFLIRWM